MKTRRFVLKAIAAAPFAGVPVNSAFALDYPTKRAQVIVTTAAGGASDVVTRLTSQALSEKLGQTFLVENRPGAGGNIAVDVSNRAPADGYTLLAIHKGMVAANSLADNLSFTFMRDFEGVAGVSNGPLLMLTHNSLPVKSLSEFIAYAKANPGKLNYASAGNGTGPHLAGELFKMQAGIEMTHIPYRGGALGFTDLLGGSVQVMFTNLPAAEFIKNGTLRVLAVTTATRSKTYPDVPAVMELVPGFEFGEWFAYVVRKGTSKEIITRLNETINESLRDPKVIAGIAVLDGEPMPLSPAELNEFLAVETAKWDKVIKAANIKPG